MARSIKSENRFIDFDLAFTKIGDPPEDLDNDGVFDTPGQQIAVKKDESAIQQALVNLLLTRKGEKPFIPDFGTEIVDLLFENHGDPLSTLKIRTSIEYAIGTYEPRVVFKDVDIDTTEIDSNNVFLNVKYSLVGEPEGSRARTVRVQFIRAR